MQVKPSKVIAAGVAFAAILLASLSIASVVSPTASSASAINVISGSYGTSASAVDVISGSYGKWPAPHGCRNGSAFPCNMDIAVCHIYESRDGVYGRYVDFCDPKDPKHRWNVIYRFNAPPHDGWWGVKKAPQLPPDREQQPEPENELPPDRGLEDSGDLEDGSDTRPEEQVNPESLEDFTF